MVETLKKLAKKTATENKLVKSKNMALIKAKLGVDDKPLTMTLPAGGKADFTKLNNGAGEDAGAGEDGAGKDADKPSGPFVMVSIM